MHCFLKQFRKEKEVKENHSFEIGNYQKGVRRQKIGYEIYNVLVKQKVSRLHFFGSTLFCIGFNQIYWNFATLNINNLLNDIFLRFQNIPLSINCFAGPGILPFNLSLGQICWHIQKHLPMDEQCTLELFPRRCGRGSRTP